MYGRPRCREIPRRLEHLINVINPFPPTDRALRDPNGLLAMGGDLAPGTLVSAYAQGIFPWFSDDEEILWWTPCPRLVLQTGNIHVSRSMSKFLRQSDWTLMYDAAFSEVIQNCATVARDGEATGTWITQEMRSAYQVLHKMGVAHSVEVYEANQLIGGLYGVLLGRVFFGESMFSLRSNASKVAFIALSRACAQGGVKLIDCQVDNPHLMSLGATSMPRKDFENHLRDAIKVTMEEILSDPLCLVPERRRTLPERLGSFDLRSMEQLL